MSKQQIKRTVTLGDDTLPCLSIDELAFQVFVAQLDAQLAHLEAQMEQRGYLRIREKSHGKITGR